MKIGILDCGHPPDYIRDEFGKYSDMFANLLANNNFEYQAFDVVDMHFPSAVDSCDGWLLSGSKHGAYEDLPFIAPLEDFVRAAYARPVPMVGICFGHQIIAQALGGRVEKFSRGWAMGRQKYAFDGLGTLALNAWHQDQVVDLPPTATPVAQNNFCAYPALIYGDRAYTVQAHPELIAPIFKVYMERRAAEIGMPPDLIASARSDLDKPTDEAVIATQIANFFKSAHAA